jgi:hypothetical protein
MNSHRILFPFLILGVLVVVFFFTSQAQQTFKPEQVLTSDPKIIIGKLDK